MKEIEMFRHPTNTEGRAPETVIMVLLGQSKIHYANILSSTHSRVFPPDAEVWTCNAGFRLFRHDLLFVMDDLLGEYHKWPDYGDDLKLHDRPIFSSTQYPGYPKLLRYPLEWVCKRLGLSDMDRYFFNTVPYMLAYAGAIGVKNIYLFGADYWHPETAGREDDRANAEWWLGFLRGRLNTKILLSSETTLMCARESKPLYGYRLDPRLSMDRKRADSPASRHEPERHDRMDSEPQAEPQAGYVRDPDALLCATGQREAPHHPDADPSKAPLESCFRPVGKY